MQLRDRGLLKLDDSITKYIPELRQVNNPYGDMSEITIRQLMSHSAGFQAGSFPWSGDKDWQPFEPTKWEQLVAMMPYMQIQFKPGSKFSYSNPAIIYLGRIIEILSHDDFEVYIDKNIFRPLEMRRSYFDSTPYHLLKYRSASYWIENGKLTTARFDADTGITVSNGGLNSPFPDMVKYLNFLLGVGDKNLYEEILKRSSLEEMWQPQVAITPDAIVTPKDCGRCHEAEVTEFNSSHHAKAGRILGSLDNVLAEIVEGRPASGVPLHPHRLPHNRARASHYPHRVETAETAWYYGASGERVSSRAGGSR